MFSFEDPLLYKKETCESTVAVNKPSEHKEIEFEDLKKDEAFTKDENSPG